MSSRGRHHSHSTHPITRRQKNRPTHSHTLTDRLTQTHRHTQLQTDRYPDTHRDTHKGIWLSLFPTKGNGHGSPSPIEWFDLAMIHQYCLLRSLFISFVSSQGQHGWMDVWILFVLFRDCPQINLLDNLRVSVPVTCRHPFPVTGDSNSQALAPVDTGPKCLYNGPIRQ